MQIFPTEVLAIICQTGELGITFEGIIEEMEEDRNVKIDRKELKNVLNYLSTEMIYCIDGIYKARFDD